LQESIQCLKQQHKPVDVDAAAAGLPDAQHALQ
jgi:hypothetical protein